MSSGADGHTAPRLSDIPKTMAAELELMKAAVFMVDGTHAQVAERARMMLLDKLARAEQALKIARSYLACAPQDFGLFDCFYDVVGPILDDCDQIKDKYRQLQDAQGQA